MDGGSGSFLQGFVHLAWISLHCLQHLSAVMRSPLLHPSMHLVMTLLSQGLLHSTSAPAGWPLLRAAASCQDSDTSSAAIARTRAVLLDPAMDMQISLREMIKELAR